MKILIFAIIGLICLGGFSDEQRVLDPAVRRLSRDEFQNLSGKDRRTYLEKLFQINHGGMVAKAGTGKGSIKIVMSIGEYDHDLLNEKLKSLDRFMKWPVSVVNGDSVSVAEANAAMKQLGANIGVFVVDAENLPVLLTAPEDGWAIVNVSPLKTNGASPATVQKRIVKEIIRGLSLATGCGNVGGVLQPIKSTAELDLLGVYEFPLTARGAVSNTLNVFGVEPRVEKSYKNACTEGWAPAPTNEFQKAIWDKIHQLPTEPIKIKPETKKVTE